MGKGRDSPNEYGEVDLSGRTVRFRLQRSGRRTVGLTVDAAEGLVVHSPKRLSRKELERILHGKARWILAKTAWADDQRRHLAEVRWAPGHAFPYRGEHLPLALRLNGVQVGEPGRRTRISASAPRLDVEDGVLLLRLMRLHAPDAEGLKEHLLDAYREAAREEIARCLPAFAERLEVQPNMWRIKSQRRRWGSCSPRGNLNFNWRLILAPPDVLDYVVVHELCHLRHPNHSPRFWAEVGSILPDHHQPRKWLRMLGETLFIDEVPIHDEDRSGTPLPQTWHVEPPHPEPAGSLPAMGVAPPDALTEIIRVSMGGEILPSGPFVQDPSPETEKVDPSNTSPEGTSPPPMGTETVPKGTGTFPKGTTCPPSQTALFGDDVPMMSAATRGRGGRKIKLANGPRQLELL